MFQVPAPAVSSSSFDISPLTKAVVKKQLPRLQLFRHATAPTNSRWLRTNRQLNKTQQEIKETQIQTTSFPFNPPQPCPTQQLQLLNWPPSQFMMVQEEKRS